MTVKHETSKSTSGLIISKDGVAHIGEVMYRPISKKARELAYDEKVSAVKQEKDENLYACFDVFNTDGHDLCAHLDLFYDQGGYMSFTEQRQNEEGYFEVQFTDVPASVFVDDEILSKNRKQLTTKMLEYGKKLHDRNKNADDDTHWKRLDANMKLLQRCKFNRNE